MTISSVVTGADRYAALAVGFAQKRCVIELTEVLVWCGEWQREAARVLVCIHNKV
jgi:hypothetical protein